MRFEASGVCDGGRVSEGRREEGKGEGERTEGEGRDL